MTDTAESYGLGVLASDLDGDGDVDVYVGNDSNPNFLYRNDGHGIFTEVAGWSGAGVSADGRPQASMGVDAGDFDGDGLPELVATNFAQDYCTLYKNEGQLFFSDISSQQRMKEFTHRQVSWGCAFFDFNLDAHLDLLILNGHIYPQVDGHADLTETYRQLPTLLHNVNGNLEDVAHLSGPGFQQAESMRGLAIGDYDDDGKPDLLITAIDAPPLLLHNETKTAFHWSKIRLLNEHGSPAMNALAKLTTGEIIQSREVRSGSTYCSQGSFDLLFGFATYRGSTRWRFAGPTVKSRSSTTCPWMNRSSSGHRRHHPESGRESRIQSTSISLSTPISSPSPQLPSFSIATCKIRRRDAGVGGESKLN